MGTEDVKVTAMNMYKYKERLRLYKRWPCGSQQKTLLLPSLFAFISGTKVEIKRNPSPPKNKTRYGTS